MTHNLQTQTFTFKGVTYKKGVDSYSFSEALTILAESEKTLISYVDDNKKIIHHGDVSNPVQYLEHTNNRILVNKRGNALGCIIYLGKK